MNQLLQEVMNEMFLLYKNDPRRIQHFTKVYAYASYIGSRENLSEVELEILEIAAITHDIGIHYCEEIYGNCNGKLQEKEGPRIVEELLNKVKVNQKIMERVCFLIAHHHTYKDIEGMDWQILIEADFLVNAYEDNLKVDAIIVGMKNLFATKSGIELCKRMFGLVE